MQNGQEILSALQIKYGRESSTHIQLLFEKSNTLTMDEDPSVVGHVNHMTLVAKDLSTARISMSDKMQNSTILNILPP